MVPDSRWCVHAMYSDLLQALKERSFGSSGFSAKGALISKPVVPHREYGSREKKWVGQHLFWSICPQVFPSVHVHHLNVETVFQKPWPKTFKSFMCSLSYIFWPIHTWSYTFHPFITVSVTLTQIWRSQWRERSELPLCSVSLYLIVFKLQTLHDPEA